MLSAYQGNHTIKITHVRKKLRTRNTTGERLELWNISESINGHQCFDINRLAAIQLDEGMWTLDITTLSELFSPVLFLNLKKCKENTYTRHADYKTLRRLQIISNNPFVFFHRKLIDVNRCNSRFQLSFSPKCF